MDLANKSIHAWLVQNGMKTEKGDPIDFRDHLFLFDIYKDLSPFQVIYKPAQIGASTAFNLKIFWLAKHLRAEVIYTLPTSDDVKDFVGGKTNRLIGQNKILRDYTKDRDTIEQKQVGDSMIYFRGTWTKRAAMMVPSDINIHDEVDASNQDVIEDYQSRQQHSKLGWRWYFSHPSVEGNGVSKYWPDSDQKHWFIKCSSCSKKQFLSWPDSIDIESEQYICKHCKKELSTQDRRVGEWVQKYKDKQFSGYWISLMMCPWVPASDIIAKHENNTPEFFANRVLGLPYVSEGGKFTPELIYNNLTSKTNTQENPIVIGCDSGLKKHYVVGNRQGIFYNGVATDWSEIEVLLSKRFPGSIAVIDALPDLTEPRRLREKYPGRVYLCQYSADRKTMKLIRWGKNDEHGVVIADRNRVIQLLVDELRQKRHPFHGTRKDWSHVVEQCSTMYRIETTDSLGRPVHKWESSNDNDHFLHALVYHRIGMSKYGSGGAVLNDKMDLGIPEAPTLQPDGKMDFIIGNPVNFDNSTNWYE